MRQPNELNTKDSIPEKIDQNKFIEDKAEKIVKSFLK